MENKGSKIGHTDEKSYGHMHKKGGDHHLSSSPGRNSTPGPGSKED